MNKDLISIIIPAYNCERYVKECLDSVLGQSYTNLEVIAVDDGSDDRTLAILAASSEADGRLRVLRQAHSGAGTARNFALSEATGNYIMFVDADDRLPEGAINKLYTAIQATGADIVKGHYYAFDDKGHKWESIFRARWPRDVEVSSHMALELMLLQRFSSSAWGKIFRRHIINDDIRFGEGMTFNEDFHFLWQLYHQPLRIALIPREVYAYRMHEHSVTSGFDPRHLEILPYIDSLPTADKTEKRLLKIYKDSRIAHMAFTMRRAGAHKLYPAEYKNLCGFLRKNILSFAFNPHYQLRDRVKAFLSMVQGW